MKTRLHRYAGDERGAGLIRSVVSLLVLALIAGVAYWVLVGSKNNESAKQDVKVTACSPVPAGGKPKASGTVTNSTSKTSTYVINVVFPDGSGNTLSEGAATLKRVDAGQSATWQLTGARSAKGLLTCKVSKVARTHLPGQ